MNTSNPLTPCLSFLDFIRTGLNTLLSFEEPPLFFLCRFFTSLGPSLFRSRSELSFTPSQTPLSLVVVVDTVLHTLFISSFLLFKVYKATRDSYIWGNFKRVSDIIFRFKEKLRKPITYTNSHYSSTLPGVLSSRSTFNINPL